MRQAVKVTEDIWFLGSSDRRLSKFENCHPVPNGISYNSYLILDEKTVLLDTVDRSIVSVFLENLEFLLDGRPLDYLVINHMEPDHTATLRDVLIRHPETIVVGTAKAHTLLHQFFDINLQGKPCRSRRMTPSPQESIPCALSWLPWFTGRRSWSAMTRGKNPLLRRCLRFLRRPERKPVCGSDSLRRCRGCGAAPLLLQHCGKIRDAGAGAFK